MASPINHKINSKLTQFFCKSISTKLQQPLSAKLLNNNCRSFSTDKKNEEKCPKANNKPEKCRKMTIAGCDPPNPNISCEPTYTHVECHKQLAPYPSYSELCAKDPEYKPSECRMCPWTATTNPNFKKQKH